jgi:hypothetical protein
MAAAPDVGVVTLAIGLPAPLVDGLAMAAQRPVPERTGELLFAVVKTTTWAAAGRRSDSERCGRCSATAADRAYYRLFRQVLEFRRAVAALTDEPRPGRVAGRLSCRPRAGVEFAERLLIRS